MKLSLQCGKLSWSTEKKNWFALLNVKVCKYIVSISIGGLYQCYIVTKTAGDLTEAESKLFMADHNKKNKRNNQTLALGDMLPETRDMLRQFYRPFNVNLSRLLNSDQYLWSN